VSDSPAQRASASPLRFVILRHDGIANPHFDLMFETERGGPLRTWRSPEWPITDRVRITPLDLHRRDYLDYEGPLSNDRGWVKRIASGTFILATPDPSRMDLALSGAEIEGLLLRRWQDSSGQVFWDAAAI
jgi:hypothetical protein